MNLAEIRKKNEDISTKNCANKELKVIYVSLLLNVAKKKYNLSDSQINYIISLVEKSHIWNDLAAWNITKSIINAFSFIMMNIINTDPDKLWIVQYETDEEIITWLWLDDLKNNKNPIVIYKWWIPLYWNTAMEELTWYSFEEIMEKYRAWEDIMELLYSWSNEELSKVKWALSKWESYENAVFTLMSKDWNLHQVAWFTRFKMYSWEKYSIRSWSEETSKIIEFLDQSNIAVRDMFNDIMNDKDSYTKWHINRVRVICSMIWKNSWYSDYQLEQLSNMAFLHDLWKRFIDDEILKKTWIYTPNERRIMDSHPWMWIKKVINSWYEVYAEWMIHHSDFYSDNWDPNLKPQELIERIKAWEEIDLLLFNKILWRNIPESWRIISIADTIDAIVSRRSYSVRAWKPISEIIDFVTKELLTSTWLVVNWSNITLNKDIWKRTEDIADISMPYCIEYIWANYIPIQGSRIQFDPQILIRNYENWDLIEEIKHVILENDKIVVKEKVDEFMDSIGTLEEKKRLHEKYLSWWMWQCPLEFEFNENDEKELARLTIILESLLEIKRWYQLDNV